VVNNEVRRATLTPGDQLTGINSLKSDDQHCLKMPHIRTWYVFLCDVCRLFLKGIPAEG
jgi:hypothetical protein